jgi:hypothetical protein
MDNPFDMLSINFYPKIARGGPFILLAEMNWLMFFFCYALSFAHVILNINV